MGLTLSVGPWWGDAAPSDRSWIHANILAEAGKINVEIRHPEESNFYPWPQGGMPLTPQRAEASGGLAEFRSVTNFIIESDPAVSSYLSGATVDKTGREPRDAKPQHIC